MTVLSHRYEAQEPIAVRDGGALDTPDEVFATAGEMLGPHLKRIPDGEPGGRRLWISFQVPVLRAHPDLEVAGSTDPMGLVPLKLRDGVRPEDLHFGELGYSREARASYQDFLANLIVESAGRPVAYVHMPVPVHRTDEIFYQPLSGLRLPAGTELCLGLVHASDGVDGTRRRMAVAGKYVRDFGIASECGISRGRHPELAAEFMRVYAGAAGLGPAAATDA